MADIFNATITGALTTGQALFVTTTSRILVALAVITVVLSLIYVYAAMKRKETTGPQS